MGFSGDSPRIEKGLALYEPDYYAVLGIPVNATPKQVTEGYRQVARALRVGFVGMSQLSDMTDFAQTLITKLVNPAKETLSKDKDRIEYDAVLQIRIRRLLDNPPRDLWPETSAVQALRSATNLEEAYFAAIQVMSRDQYSSIEQALARTGIMSELNLAFLLLKASKPAAESAPAKKPASSVSSAPSANSRPAPFTPSPPTPISGISRPSSNPKPPSPPVSPQEDTLRPVSAPLSGRTTPKLTPSETRFMQALQMMERDQYQEAIQFLTIAINGDPNQAEYLANRGQAYLKLGNRGLARADFQQALKLDPKSKLALDGLQAMTTVSTQPLTPPPPAPTQKAQPQPKPDPKKSSGGLFGGLFGKKN